MLKIKQNIYNLKIKQKEIYIYVNKKNNLYNKK